MRIVSSAFLIHYDFNTQLWRFSFTYDKSSSSGPDMTIAFSPVSTGGTGYSMNSEGCFLFTVTLLWSFNHPCTCICWQEIISEWLIQEEHPLEPLFYKNLVHPLRLPHSALLAASCCCSTASCRAPWSSAFEERHIYMVLPFEHDEEVFQVLKCYNQSVQWSLHESGPTGVTTQNMVRRRGWTWYSWSITALQGATSGIFSTYTLIVHTLTPWFQQGLKLLPLVVQCDTCYSTNSRGRSLFIIICLWSLLYPFSWNIRSMKFIAAL